MLSWDLARELVLLDVARTGALTAPPGVLGLIPPGSFGTVPRLLYHGLVQGGAGPLLTALGLKPPPCPATSPSADVPIPTSGQGRVLQSSIAFQPRVCAASATREM